MTVERSEIVLCTQNLGKHYVQRRPLTRAKFTVQAFQDVNLSIHRRTTLAIVGESGAGKSSLARCLALLEAPTQGEIWCDGRNLLLLRESELFPIRRKVQLVFQDPASALNPRFTAGEIVAEPLLIQRIGTKTQQRERALGLMEQLGLPPKWERKFPFEFSGGQRQRLAIARALALEPKLLVFDEILSNLDLANQEIILQLLNELQRAHSLTYIHVCHDLRIVSRIADEVAVMHAGRIVERKPATELFANPGDPYTKELFEAMPSLEMIAAGRST
jgi:ABC-type glutathione transport system ATPase component